jgi:exosortase
LAFFSSAGAGVNQRDLAWGLLLGGILAISPVSGASRVIPSLIGGALLAGLVVVFRRQARKRAPDFLTPDSAPALIARPSLSAWALLAALAIVFLPTLYWLYQQYTVSVWRNAHGLFLPVVLFVMMRSRLRKDSDPSAASSPWGIVLIVAGVLLALLDAGVDSGLISTVGLIVTLPGLSLYMLGARRTRLIAFPLALSVFILPLPQNLPDPLWLPSGTATMVELYFDLLGVPSQRIQTFFRLPVGLFGVSTNCSGLSAFYAAVLVCTILLASARSWGRRALIVLSVWPITVVINGVRGAGLIWLCNRYGLGISDTPVHGLSGIGTLLLVLAALLAMADWRSILKVKP